MKRSRFIIMLGAAVAFSWNLTGASLPTAHAASTWLPDSGAYVPVQSLVEQRYERTIPQQFDFSCGSASLATLLTYQYGDPISEADVFQAMWAYGDQNKIRVEGFSLLDIKEYLDRRGYVSNGYQIAIEKLLGQQLPGIVLINDEGYNHFVVIKGYQHGRVLIGDPAKGARTMTLEKLEKIQLNPIVFVITSTPERAVFNGVRDWATRPLAPLGAPATLQNLDTITMLPRSTGDI